MADDDVPVPDEIRIAGEYAHRHLQADLIACGRLLFIWPADISSKLYFCPCPQMEKSWPRRIETKATIQKWAKRNVWAVVFLPATIGSDQ